MTGPILYFIAGEAPTNEEFAKAEPFMKKGPFLEFVSLKHLDLAAEPVNASGVAGLVPESYKTYPVLDNEKAAKAAKVKE